MTAMGARLRSDAVVGLFALAGLACLGYLSFKLGKVEVLGDRGYLVRAEFDSVAGLTKGASVQIAGVDVGRVAQIRLRGYRAEVAMRIERGVRLQTDAIVSVRTKGLIGEKYLAITPGASERLIAPGGVLRETEDAVDIEELISRYIHGKI